MISLMWLQIGVGFTGALTLLFVLRWLHRNGEPAGSSALLVNAVRDAEWPEGRVHVFAHGERGYMKALRDVLFKQRGLERSQVSLSGYWASGRVEDQFQAEKKLPIGQI